MGQQVDVSSNHLLDFMAHGHIEAPDYNTSLKEVHAYPKGSVFLTVCVHEYEDESSEEKDRGEEAKKKNARQLYRIDIPLRLRKDQKSERLTMSHLVNLGMPHMDSNTFEKIADNYRLAGFHAEQPYILIPRCTSCASVTLTVSQVKTDFVYYAMLRYAMRSS